MQHLFLTPDALVTASVLNDIMIYTFRTLFFLSALLLMVIVLLQEGKGGGLASALGGQGAETFGVSTGGVNKVTLFLAGVFLLSGLAHAVTFGKSISSGIATKKGKADAVLPGGGNLPGGTDGNPLKEPPKDAPGGGAPKDAPPKDSPPKDAPGGGKPGDGK
jgi:preprotein translocase subunit SecG